MNTLNKNHEKDDYIENKPRKYSIRQILAWLKPYFFPEKHLLFLTVLLVVLKSLSGFYLVLLARAVLNILENYVKNTVVGPPTSLFDLLEFIVIGNDHTLSVSDIPLISLLMVATVIFVTTVSWLRNLVPILLVSNVATQMRRQLYLHLQRMDLHFFHKTRCGEIASRMTNDIVNGVAMFSSIIPRIVFIFIMLPIMLYFMFKLNVFLTLVTLAMAMIMLINIFFMAPGLRKRSRKVQENLGIINGEITEKFGAIKSTQSFTNEDYELTKFTQQVNDFRTAVINRAKLASIGGALSELLPRIGTVVIICIGANIVIKNQLTIADLMFFWMIRGRIFTPFSAFAGISLQFATGMGSVDRVMEFYHNQPKVSNNHDAIELSDAKGSVEFKNVSFSYESEKGQSALTDISFAVNPGDSVAFVGHSGAGKSTLVDMITRFYDPYTGSVTIDGNDIRNYTLQSLRDNIGLVMQEAPLLSGTIRENVLYGKPDASEEEIKSALENANALKFSQEMVDGLDTMVGERGVTLSGGQKQRIAIAQAFLKDPRILILDEATSALDSISEIRVQEALNRLMKNRTTFIIAHRLSTIADVDRIIVLEKGRLVEEGGHTELISLDGYYSNYYNQQYKNYKVASM